MMRCVDKNVYEKKAFVPLYQGIIPPTTCHSNLFLLSEVSLRIFPSTPVRTQARI